MTIWLCDIHSSHNQGRYKAVADPDPQIKGGGRSFRPSDKEGRYQKKIFPPFGPNFGLKISALCMVILISESGTDFCSWNPQSWVLENITSNSDPHMTVIRNPSFADNETGILGLGSSIQDCLGFLYMGRDRRISQRETFQHPCLWWKKNTSGLHFRNDFLHSNMQFSTKDEDNDRSPHSCA